MATDDPQEPAPHNPLTSTGGWITIVTTFALLLAHDLILIFFFDEYEPKFGRSASATFAAIGNGVLTLLLGAPLIIAVEIGRRSKLQLAIGLGILLLAFGIFTTFDTYKAWAARRAVQHVYWHNVHRSFDSKEPFTDLQEFERPRYHLWLHGLTQIRTDPWGRPYHYQLISGSGDHPHRRTWDVNWLFWSDGPDGEDDGNDKHDDIDITNSMY